MNDITMQELWKAQDEKLDRTLKLNLHLLESFQKQKAASRLNSLARLKLWAVGLGILWALFLGLLIYGNQLQNIYFTVSAGMVMLFTILAVAIYIKHVGLIRSIDYSLPITQTQQKLSRLQASTFNTRFLLLQTPFYSTFFWNTEMINAPDNLFWFISVPIALLFTVVAVYLYKNLTPANMHKKWVSALIKSTPEHTAIMEAQDFLQEIEEFKNG